MKNQKNNIRTCIFSKQKVHRDNLIRFVCNDNKIIIDSNQTLEGRGFYILKNKEIIDKIISSNFLKRKFNINNEKEFYDEVIKLI